MAVTPYIPPQELAWNAANQIQLIALHYRATMDIPPRISWNATTGFADGDLVATGRRPKKPGPLPQYAPWKITNTRTGFIARTSMKAVVCYVKCFTIRHGVTYRASIASKSYHLRTSAKVVKVR